MAWVNGKAGIGRRRFVMSMALLPLAGGALARPPMLRMFELYREDRSYSDTARRLSGKQVIFQGFMAPHLKVESDFFILSNTPVDVCPFCESEDDWIDTIIFVRMKKKQPAIKPGDLVEVTGKLEIGPQKDAATGFFSMVRLTDAEYRKLT